MQSKGKAHSEIDVIVYRAGKEVYRADRVHNIMSPAMLTDMARMFYFVQLPVTVTSYTHTVPIKETLPGTFSQSGTTVTRQSGAHSLTSSAEFYAFADGTHAGFRTAGSVASITVSKSQTVATQALNVYKITSLGTASIGATASTTNGSATLTSTYAAGVVTWQTAPGGFYSFAASASSYTLSRIAVSFLSSAAYSFHYDLPVPFTVNIGDVIAIRGFRLQITFDTYAPRAHPTSPINGLTTAAISQRLYKVNGNISSPNQPDRIYLVTTPNAVTVPSDLPVTDILASSLTVAHTITCFTDRTNPTLSNDLIFMDNLVGVVGSTITDVKQIYWGNAASGVLYGVIELTTPQTISINKVLSITSTHQLTPGIP
jgi:hypothetical protein